jgi:hypothetical protein
LARKRVLAMHLGACTKGFACNRVDICMLTFLLFLLAGLFLPLYPLSIGANLLLKRQVGVDGADPLSRPSVKAAAIVLMPLIGVD